MKVFSGRVVGKDARKIDAIPLAMGKPLYTDDFTLPGMLHAKILWSPHPHALIKDIDTRKAEALPGVRAVICYKNIPRVIHTTAGQGWPEPSPYDTVMFDNKVRHVGDRVAAVAADTEEIAEKALKLIKVDYEPLPAIFDLERAMDEGAPVIHDEPDCKYIIPVFYDPKHNHCAHIDLEAGSFDDGVKDADFVIERKFKNHYGQHCALEPHSCISYLDPGGRLVVRSSTQVPYHVRRIVAQCLEIPERMVRVIKPRIGGGFGSKQEMLLEDVCGMLTLRTKRPVRLVLSREEVFVSSRTRHQMAFWLKSGVKKDGSLAAISMKVISNAGAYGSHAMTVMSNCCAKTLPLYKCNNIKFVGDTVYTNLPQAGAYRGYGVFEASFPMGVMMDEMAEAVGMDPVDFWLKNTVREGDTHPIFEKLGEVGKGVAMTIKSCSLPECVRKGAEMFGWREKREEYSKQKEGKLMRGVGMVCTVQGATVPFIDMASVFAKMNDDGSFNLLMGATDLGTGADTVLSQIFAEVLDIPLEDVIPYVSDTDITPFDKGAYASGTTYLTGAVVFDAAHKIKEQILHVAAEMLGEPKENLRVENKGVVSVSTGERVEYSQIAGRAFYGRNQFQISATASRFSPMPPQSYAVHFVEVVVDTETGQVTVPRYVVALDCGTPINPRLAEGQAEGAVLNAVSYALTEEFIFDGNGRVLNPSFANYKIFTIADVPKIISILVPSYEPSGPYGAKSAGEVCINGALPAISNAIYNAVGIRLYESPFTPERVLKALKEKKL
ncbi:MAG: molybdopterin cofactor-binding domain-containing protein [Candidatus Hadarchaeota archaeon]